MSDIRLGIYLSELICSDRVLAALTRAQASEQLFQGVNAVSCDLPSLHAVVINAAPAKNGSEDPSVADARGAMQALDVPTWGGQITHRPELSLSLAHGAGINEFSSGSPGSEEIGSLWRALTRSFEAIEAMTGNHAQSA